MLLGHDRYYGSGMDSLMIVCSRNMNVILVCTLMGDHMLLEPEPNFGSTMGAVGGVDIGNVEAHELQESKHGARHRRIQVKHNKHEPSQRG